MHRLPAATLPLGLVVLAACPVEQTYADLIKEHGNTYASETATPTSGASAWGVFPGGVAELVAAGAGAVAGPAAHAGADSAPPRPRAASSAAVRSGVHLKFSEVMMGFRVLAPPGDACRRWRYG